MRALLRGNSAILVTCIKWVGVPFAMSLTTLHMARTRMAGVFAGLRLSVLGAECKVL